ncbi:hypothetical protein [Dolichospermum heterosporum]|uniref:Uncharacterized protein n=1 Tax=Dolichospermum heterosporum TAC447 TaxID=747523 RepID=A0ABY5LRR7_9CYAN|nr:hypothetical protein [Dolichospermum heterosporum]UUO13714.1 hypothetical protein NG743_16770 [Dolichospermum heterosporum TAC447]
MPRIFNFHQMSIELGCAFLLPMATILEIIVFTYLTKEIQVLGKNYKDENF